MSDSTKCPRCGGESPADFPPGICPPCLLQQGLSPSTFVSGEGSKSGSAGGRRRSWTPPTPAELAPRFPQLEIVELLGQGGMGAVYKVRQRDLDRWAALKILPDEVAHDPNFAERFQREARALALLGHQHIVIVYEFGQRDGVYFLLMEFIDGVTLRQAIRASQISAKDALGIVAQICDALQFAHEEGVVHRDIKPENILIDKRGRVKIADFGLAKLLSNTLEAPALTGTHQVMGTPMYMAPEQMEGTRGVDHRADIFSLGVVFYELLTGELPLGRFAPPSQKYSLDIRLDEVVLRTLEKEPDRRYQRASDVKCDVESIRSQPPILQPPKPNQRMRSFKLWSEPRADNSIDIVQKQIEASWYQQFSLKRVVIGLLVGFGLCFLFLYLVIQKNTTYDQWMSMKTGASLERQISDTMQENQRLHSQVQDLRRLINASNQTPVAGATRPNPEAPTEDQDQINAPVQFTAEGPKLHRSHGVDIFSDDQRKLLNGILKQIHEEYLSLEDARTVGEVKPNGTQVSTINTLDSDIEVLENKLWIEIDSQFSVEQQRFLRSKLPLFADERYEMPQLSPSGDPLNAPGGFSPMPAMGMRSMTGGSTVPTAIDMPGSYSFYTGSTSGIMNAGGYYPRNLLYPQLLGWKRNSSLIRIKIGRQGRWYWYQFETATPTQGYAGNSSVHVDYTTKVNGSAPELPSGIRRFWRENAQSFHRKPINENPGDSNPSDHIGPMDVPNQEPNDRNSRAMNAKKEDLTAKQEESLGRVLGQDNDESHKPLDEELRELDKLRAGRETPFDQVEVRINELLAKATTHADKGKILWNAAHIFGQSGIDQTFQQVIRYVTEALKYERDPIQRCRLFSYLGSAVQSTLNTPETFTNRRRVATQWLLKGYTELLAFKLPDAAPELPNVDRIGSDNWPPVNDGEINPNQVASEVRHAAQVRARKETEFVRQLVNWRDVYILQLRDMFIRLHELYAKDSDAKEQLRELTKEIIDDPKEIELLIDRIWQEKTGKDALEKSKS